MIGNLGMTEMIIIAGLALVVMGPEKFPEFAKLAMRAWRDMRGYVDDVKREMKEELKPIKNELQDLSRRTPEEYIDHFTGAGDDGSDDDPYAEIPGGEPYEPDPADLAPNPPDEDDGVTSETGGAVEDSEQSEDWAPPAPADDPDASDSAADEAVGGAPVADTPERLDG
ncbi:MAG: hypothetical protein GWP08_03105 [Nitrospiraceae bacterium]|nr:hypothetical protein [Nitrospiraceae bacterium]